MTPTPPIPVPGPRRNFPPPWSDTDALDQPPPTVRVPAVPPPPAPFAPELTPPPGRDLARSVFAPQPAEPAPATMPRPGETFLGFRLVEELGRGAFARVFLAEQQALAGRQVALKVTLKPTREADRLARLQHTNVVPVYSVHSAPPVQVICMPFLGRQTIADFLRAYHREQSSRGRNPGTRNRRSSTTVAGGSDSGQQTLSGVPRPEPAPTAPDGADLPPVPLIGDVGAVLGLLARLADGLAHAHARGILHLDLKPANVLLADTGEPMLLDFNLSFDTTGRDREMVGGTVPYMAPEQLADLRSRGRGKLDARTDLYALGVMAFEMLTGSVPFPVSARSLAEFDGLVAARREGPPSPRAANPAVTPAVEAIVRKLLAPDPADRYQTAGHLREDVERHLQNRPLRFAREGSVRERFRKWRRRNPRALGRAVLAVALGLAAGSAGAAYLHASHRATAEAVGKARAARSGLESVRVDLVVPGDPAARARGAERAAEVLAGYGLPDDPDWRERAAFARVPEANRPAVAADLGELLLLLAHAKWQDAKHRPDPDRRAAAAVALRLNRTARDCFAGSAAPPLLDQQRAELAAAAGEPADTKPAGHPATARDHFLAAAGPVADGKFATAVPHLERAVAAEPGHAAAHFCLAYCRHQLGQYDRALERYDAAAVLMPTDPRPPFQRGLVYGLQRKPALAEPEFTRAIELDPAHAEGYRNRAVARLRLGRLKEAERDLTDALARGAAPIQVRLLRGQVRERLGDRAGAADDRAAALAAEPAAEGDFLVRGLTRVKADPAGAVADFKAAAAINPRSLPALQNQAHVLADRIGDAPAALTAVSRAAELYPEFAPARVGRAVLLARLGRRDEAHREAEQALLLSADPTVTYQAACVYALTSAAHPDDRAKALTLLRQAFRDGYREVAMLDTDHDLDPLREHPEFVTFARAAKELAR